MSANGEGKPVKLRTFVGDNSHLERSSNSEQSDINPDEFAQKCTIASSEDEGGEAKDELKDPVSSQTSREGVESLEIKLDQTEPSNADDSTSPSDSSNDPFKNMFFTVPKINYAEKVIFCLDMSSDMEDIPFKLGDGSEHSPLSMVKRTIELFTDNKHFINRKHEFSLMVLYENATWVREFTNDPKEIIDSLHDLTETQACSTCDLGSMVTLITDKYELKIPRRITSVPCVFRIILIYGRSRCLFHFSSTDAREFLINYPFLILDIIYIHEPPSSENNCQEIFEALCDLDENDKSYIFEVTRNTTKLHNSMAKLLTHPSQRCAQKNAVYTLRMPVPQEVG